ncbi:MAG: hypothetical protein JWN08_1874 [Frankiales bacterium]|nr:hypothetical protein [Frankiales bacterium]
MQTSPHVVVIVDDHALFGQGLELLLSMRGLGAFEVAATTTNGDEAVPLVGRHRATIATVDLALPPRGGLAVIADIKRSYPATKVLALSGTEDVGLAERALRAGADGFVGKSSDPDGLVAPLLAVASGSNVVTPRLLAALLASSRQPQDGLRDRLSNQELALWSLIARGHETLDIAQRLLVSERTAKRMVSSLLNKIGASGRIEAAALAGRYGLLDGD